MQQSAASAQSFSGLLLSPYGVDDIPLILQDRSFSQDGLCRYASSMHDRMVGMMGQFVVMA